MVTWWQVLCGFGDGVFEKAATTNYIRISNLVSELGGVRLSMDGILRALGFDSKPDFAEKIPESLRASDFNVHEVSLAVAP